MFTDVSMEKGNTLKEKALIALGKGPLHVAFLTIIKMGIVAAFAWNLWMIERWVFPETRLPDWVEYTHTAFMWVFGIILAFQALIVLFSVWQTPFMWRYSRIKNAMMSDEVTPSVIGGDFGNFKMLLLDEQKGLIFAHGSRFIPLKTIKERFWEEFTYGAGIQKTRKNYLTIKHEDSSGNLGAVVTKFQDQHSMDQFIHRMDNACN